MGKLSAVLFDMDGIITNTNPLHFKAWKKMADEEDLYFDEDMNNRLLGISRENTLEIILKKNNVLWSDEKKKFWCDKKNRIYRDLLENLSEKDILPGIKNLLTELNFHEIPCALASSSKNATIIIKKLGLTEYFSAFADASKVKNAKPAPDLFFMAAEKVGAAYENCVGIDDSESGIEALKKAGMKAIGIESSVLLPKADLKLSSTAELTYEKILELACKE